MANWLIWIVGKHRGLTEAGDAAWDLQGVFDNEDDAVRCCCSREDFIAPVPMNVQFPQSRVEWPGVRYPLAEQPGGHFPP